MLHVSKKCTLLISSRYDLFTINNTREITRLELISELIKPEYTFQGESFLCGFPLSLTNAYLIFYGYKKAVANC